MREIELEIDFFPDIFPHQKAQIFFFPFVFLRKSWSSIFQLNPLLMKEQKLN